MIDRLAVVDPGAHIGTEVAIGPYSIIGADVEIGDGTWIGPHVVITGPTRIGSANKIYQFSSLGGDPQDKKYRGERTVLEIGDRNVIREFCTFGRGTAQDEGITRVGSDNWIMAYVHIAHDCQVGDEVIFANNASLAGHVRVDDFAILGGFTLVHQFCAIGAHVFTGMGSSISKDVPPFVMVSGSPARPYGLNVEGLKRRDFSAATLQSLRQAYKILYRSQLGLEDALIRLRDMVEDCVEISVLVSFLERQTRGILR